MEGKDLTQGKLIKTMLILLGPLLLTNLFNSIYNIVDSIWIGNLIGETGVSAITNCYPLTFIVTAISTGLSISTSVLIAQYYGAKKEEKLKSILGTSYLLAFILSFLAAIIMILTSSFWLNILNTPLEIYEETKIYFIIYLIGYIFNFLLIVIMEALRAIGNSKTPLIFVGISTAINLALDPIFINLGLGVKGTALATLIAMFIATVIGIIYINKKSKLLKIDFKYLKFNKDNIKSIFKTGYPLVFQEWFVAIIILFEVNLSNNLEIIGSASYGIIIKLEQVLWIIAKSFNTTASVMVGQFFGNKKIKETTKIFKEGLKLTILPIILTIFIVFIFPKQFCRIFVDSNEVIEMAANFLAIIGFSYVIKCPRQLLYGFILGTGHTKYVLFSSIIAGIGEISTILYLKNSTLDNLTILGIAVLVYVAIEVSLNLIYYISKKWQKEVIKKESF